MKNYLVSVIVPIYNIELYLRKCVDSIISQSYTNIEIILVDDGSTDSSREICDEYAQIDSRVRPVHKENGGLTSARKAGIEASNGDYVMIVDGDDWIDSQTIRCMVDVLQTEPNVSLVIFPYTKEYSNRSVKRSFFSNDMTFETADIMREKVYRRLFGLTNSELSHPESLDYLSTCVGKMYPREYVLQAKFVDTQVVGSYEDGIFNIFALKNCKNAKYLNYPFYHYRKTEGSLTQTYRPKLINQWNYLFSLIQLEIDDSRLSEDYQEALNNRISLSVLGIGMNELGNPNGGFFQFRRYMKEYICSELYRQSILTMRLQNLPLAWKMMMLCCKYKLSFGLAIILEMIKKMKSIL